MREVEEGLSLYGEVSHDFTATEATGDCAGPESGRLPLLVTAASHVAPIDSYDSHETADWPHTEELTRTQTAIKQNDEAKLESGAMIRCACDIRETATDLKVCMR